MNLKAFAISAAMISIFASSVSYASGKDDKDDKGSSFSSSIMNTNTNSNSNANTNSNTNSNSNSNTNSVNNIAEGGSSTSTSSATGGSATNTNSNTATGGTGGTSNSRAIAVGGAGGNSNQSQSTTLKNYNYNSSLYYPDWINVNPNTSSFSYNSVQCQGATFNATASTLTTDNWNNGYGVQGAIGFSVPLSGQGECFAVQKKMRSQIEFKAAAEQALMCKQLETAGVNFNLKKELSACLPQK